MKEMLADIERRMPGRKDVMLRALAHVNPSHLLDPKLLISRRSLSPARHLKSVRRPALPYEEVPLAMTLSDKDIDFLISTVAAAGRQKSCPASAISTQARFPKRPLRSISSPRRIF